MWQNANEFSYYIQKRALEEDASCNTVLLQYCEELDLDPEEVAPLVNRSLKDRLEVEFADMGLLKKSPSLYD